MRLSPAAPAAQRQRQDERGDGYEQRGRAPYVKSRAWASGVSRRVGRIGRIGHIGWTRRQSQQCGGEGDGGEAYGQPAKKYRAPAEFVHQQPAAERAGHHAERSERGHYTESASPELGWKQPGYDGGRERHEQPVAKRLKHAQREHQREALRHADGDYGDGVHHEADDEHSLEAEDVRRSAKPKLQSGTGADVEDDDPLDRYGVGSEAGRDVRQGDVYGDVERGEEHAGRGGDKP